MIVLGIIIPGAAMTLTKLKIQGLALAITSTVVASVILTGCTAPIDKPITPPVVAPPVVSAPHGAPLGVNTIADVAEEAMKSVVNIDTTTSVAVPQYPKHFGIPFEMFGDEPLEPHIKKYEMRGTGTGVIFREDGYILTNNHVVGQATTIKVTLNDKRVVSGKVVGRDRFTDIAVVKLNATNLPKARLGSAKQLRPGDWAVAIGSPAGLSNTVTVGIISALGRSLGEQLGDVGLIQTDAAINPGNSGGPLLNLNGDVIGINTAIRKDYQNIGFAVPIEVAREVAESLINTGTAKHAYIGILMQDLNEEINKALNMAPGSKGVVIAEVKQGSPADDAGLRTGDIVVKVGDESVASAKEVQVAIRKHQPGETVPITLSRNGQSASVNLTIGDYPSETQ